MGGWELTETGLRDCLAQSKKRETDRQTMGERETNKQTDKKIDQVWKSNQGSGI